MVSLTNGVLSRGNGDQRALENGYHSSSIGGSRPKYKPRKVSAIRDFPPGCGLNAPRIGRQSDENVVVSGENQTVDAIGSNCVGALGIMVDYQSGEVEGKAGEDMNASLDDLVVKMVAAATVEIEGLATQVEPIGSEWSNDLENVALQVPKELHGKDDQVLVEESLEEDGSKSLEAEENKIVIEIGAVGRQSKALLGVGTVGNRATPEVIPKSLSPPQWPIGDSGVVEDRATIPKNKYRRRRVSANRDFPPFCGNNAPRLTEEDQLRIVGSKSLCGLENSASRDIPPVCGNKEPRPTEEGWMRISESESLHGLENLTARSFPPFYWNKAPKPTEEDHVKISRSTSLCGEKDSVIRVCPLRCGSNAPGPTEDYHLKISRSVENSATRESPPVCRHSVRPTEENQLRISVRKSSYGVENSATCDFPPVCGNKSPRPTGEDQLRISGSKSLATRDFPPFCGKNALKPTEEDRVKISSRKSMSVVKKVIERKEALEETIMDGGTLGETSRDSLEDMTQRDVVQGDTVESGGGITEPNFEMIQLKETLPESMKSLAVIKQESKYVTTPVQTVRELSTAVAKSIGYIQDDDSENIQSEEIVAELVKPLTAITMDNEDVTSFVGTLGKDLVVYSQEKSVKRKNSGYIVGLGNVEETVIVQGLMAAPFCPWRQGRCRASRSLGNKSKSKIRRPDLTRQQKSKLVIKTDNCEVDYLKGKAKQDSPVSAEKATQESSGAIVVRDAESQLNIEQQEDFPAHEAQNDFDVSLPPFGPNSSSYGDARNRVRETLRLFQAICRKLLQGQEANMIDGEELKSKQEDDKRKRIDLLAAKIIKKKRNFFNTGRNMVGAVPGVEVGDEFQFRVELAIVGIHRPYQGGIDYSKHNGELIAISIVASGGYADDLDNADVLIYSGQGGSAKGKDKPPEHQKLERGNLALKNSVSVKNPVRVIRGWKEKVSESLYAKGKVATSYVYDGLYTVEKYWMDTGPHGKLVFMFELKRIPGQPELAWTEVKKSKKYKIREGVRVDDISGGKESFPICAVNTIDDEKLAPFIYTTRMIYPEWYCPEPPNGCDCGGRCSYSRKCLCALKNGGEIPYNYNGAIVEAKPLIYECGPCCKCPPSCYNRVSQHGIKIQVEIFKTESRGWGVRSLSSITSGTFICEYTGELLEDKEAEQRVGNDEYLFDIGQNYNDCSHKHDTQSDLSAFIEDGSFTIDAAQYGNVGRFINHSCSPNLYAQNVLYDHEDKRMPHIMLFAAENIPPLQELTYHYNYSMDEVHDLNGNIKMKSCYCGSAECTGRMY